MFYISFLPILTGVLAVFIGIRNHVRKTRQRASERALDEELSRLIRLNKDNRSHAFWNKTALHFIREYQCSIIQLAIAISRATPTGEVTPHIYITLPHDLTWKEYNKNPEKYRSYLVDEPKS